MIDRRLLKKHFYERFVKIPAILAVFNFPHYKPMETLSCHSNQTKEPIFSLSKLSIPKPKDATDKNWAQLSQWFQRRCCLNVLTDEDDNDK